MNTVLKMYLENGTHEDDMSWKRYVKFSSVSLLGKKCGGK